MKIQDIINWLIPKEDKFYASLEHQACIAYESAAHLLAFRQGESAENIANVVQQLEHKGDKLVHEIEEALAKSYVTPIDREDIQKLSMELDDIIDLTNGAVRAIVLFGVNRPTEPMMQLIDVLVSCTVLIKDAVPCLRHRDYSSLIDAARTIRILEKDGDVVFRNAISDLFHDDSVNAKRLLREQEVLEDLEDAIDHCDSVAGTLTNIAIKHG